MVYCFNYVESLFAFVFVMILNCLWMFTCYLKCETLEQTRASVRIAKKDETECCGEKSGEW